MSTNVNADELAAKVKKMYQLVAEQPHDTYHFELGRPLATRLGYAPDLLDQVPAGAMESFAGVGYFSTSPVSTGVRRCSTWAADPEWTPATHSCWSGRPRHRRRLHRRAAGQGPPARR